MRYCWLSVLAAVLLWTPLQAQETKDFQTPKEAYEVGLTFLRSKNLAKAQAALEAAAAMKPDAKLNQKILRALLQSYHKEEDYSKHKTTMEAVIRDPTSPAEKYVSRINLFSFLQARKKVEEAVEQYEEMLRKDRNDRTLLYILSGLYAEALRDPARAAAITERLAHATREATGKVDAQTTEQLARQYVQAGRTKDGAELYETLAGDDANGKSMHLKDAASAWLKAGEPDKAKAAAKRAAAAGPDQRSPLLTHFWHRHLGEVFLATGENRLAVEHLQKAIDNTNIEGYRKDCRELLEKAKKAS
jgi:tetratricopeptide (TPR) repeat protein